MYEKTCLYCGKWFESKRWGKGYCSEACRAAGQKKYNKEKWEKTKAARKYNRDYRNAGNRIVPTLRELTPDELLHYGRTQTGYYRKAGIE